MPLIKKDYIQNKLLPSAKIEDVIGSYVKLKKQGVNYTCCCPFHNEKTPSFVVSPTKGFFKCFGCGVHGTAIDFIMKYKNLTFPDAIEELARLVGSTIEYEESDRRYTKNTTNYQNYYELMDRVCQEYTKFLHEDKEAYQYFNKTRGLSSDTIVHSRLGFAPLDQKAFLNLFNDNEKKILKDLGVLKTTDSGYYYPFMKNRVIIPILDIKGRVIGFGGRCLNNDLPKYLNTAETKLFKKSKELYGLYNVLKKNNNRPSQIVIVEGYMDVISLEQHDFTQSVASLGTATTEDHFKTMFRYTDKVICLYDGDNAGQNAALKACRTAASILGGEKELRFAFLPKEHDPDSLVREGGIEAINKILDNSLSYPEFVVFAPSLKYDLQDLNNIPKYIHTVLELISHINDDALKYVCLNSLSQRVHMDVETLQRNLEEIEDLPYQNKILQENIYNSKKLEMTPIRKIITFILKEPSIVSQKYNDFDLDKFVELSQKGNLKGTDFLCHLLFSIRDNKNATTASLVEQYRNTPYEAIVNALVDNSFQKNSTQVELSFDNKILYFYELIEEILVEILKVRCNTIRSLNNDISDTLMQEYKLIQAFISK